MAHDPQGLSEWIGYFLFHPRAHVSLIDLLTAALIGSFIRGLIERIRPTRKPKPPTQQGEPRA